MLLTDIGLQLRTMNLIILILLFDNLQWGINKDFIYNYVRPIRAFGNWTMGCMDETACNYNNEANMADGSCTYAEQGYDCEGNLNVQVGDEAFGGIVFYVDSTGQRGIVASEAILDGATDPYDNGFNGFEWGCHLEYTSGQNLKVIGSGKLNTINIDNYGCMSENGGIIAAKAALNFEINGFSEWYLPSINELILIESSIANNGIQQDIDISDNNWYWSSTQYNEDHYYAEFVNFLNSSSDHNLKYSIGRVRAVSYFGDWIEGCMDSLACNYNPEANMADGSCTYPQLGYDCDGNIDVQVGDEAFGGIVFYFDSIGNYGLVAASENLSSDVSHSIESYGEGFEFGCYEINLINSNYTGVGYGYQNTINIYNHNCTLFEDGISAQQAALDFQSSNYNDWFLPSLDELYLMRNSIFESGSFISDWYWSSSNYDDLNGYYVSFFNYSNSTGYTNKYDTNPIRPIRAFGNWTMGCMDSLACNYNPEANMADGSCEYAELGYDCDGNITEYVVGMEAEGGIVFYVDSTGQRGLVADIQDLNQDGEITWQIAMSSFIDNNSQGYNDWFVPNISQLEMMFNSIGYGATDMFHNIAEFAPLSYWSSTLQNSSNAFYLNFYLGPTWLSYSDTSSDGNVRLIRAFGNWTMGCMDSLACNYNPEANMADGSCEYPQLGYDCDGNITEYVVGMEAEGGIVFYIDETGERGLVVSP